LKYEQAAQDFDAVLERYPDNKKTPDAYFMKGMALKGAHHNDAAAIEFHNVINKFPRSDQAPLAKEQLRAMGLTASPTPVRRKK
jgi:TolA-binding protein